MALTRGSKNQSEAPTEQIQQQPDDHLVVAARVPNTSAASRGTPPQPQQITEA
jgi:hypothetical protein